MESISNKKGFIPSIFILFLLLTLTFYISCSRSHSPLKIQTQPLGESGFDNSPKLGIAILQKVQNQKLPYYLLLEMAEMISNSQLNLQMSDWKPNQNIEWIPTYLDGSFDDTQDYLSNTKKNILEIHTNLTYKSGLGSEVFHVITFSLIPRVFDYNLQMKSYFYDSDGIRHELITTESLTIVDKQGKLVDRDAVDNNAEQQIYASLADMIQKSHAMILEKKYSHSDFELIEKEKNTNPFLVSIDYISCFNEYQFDYGPGVGDTVLFNNKEYSFCRTELHFYNQTKKELLVDPKDFYLVSKSDQTQALGSIPVLFVQHIKNGNFYRIKTTRNFSKSVILKGIDEPSVESMELYFLVPKVINRSITKLRWRNPQSDDEIVESWIGDLDLK